MGTAYGMCVLFIVRSYLCFCRMWKPTEGSFLGRNNQISWIKSVKNSRGSRTQHVYRQNSTSTILLLAQPQYYTRITEHLLGMQTSYHLVKLCKAQTCCDLQRLCSRSCKFYATLLTQTVDYEKRELGLGLRLSWSRCMHNYHCTRVHRQIHILTGSSAPCTR